MADSQKETPSVLQSSSGRNIRQTEAGREYQMQLKTKAYKRELQELKRQTSQVVQQHDSHVSVLPGVSEEMAQSWIHTFISFAQIESELQQLLSGAELEQHVEAHRKVMENVAPTRMAIDSYIKSIQSKKRTASASVASSRGSVQSGLQLLHIEDERRKAEAAAKLSMLKAKREIQRQKQELQWKEEDLEIQTELEIQRRQTEVVNRFKLELEGEVGDGLGEEQQSIQEQQVKRVTSAQDEGPASAEPTDRLPGDAPAEPSSILGPVTSHDMPQPTPARSNLPEPAADSGDSRPTHPGAPTSSSTELLSGLAHLLSEQGKRSTLPALEPEVFRGDVESFHLWIKSFESYIETRTSAATERLHFLARYTSGEARNVIQGYLHLNSEDAYHEAKTKLQERYGNAFVTAQTYKRRLHAWPKILPGDGKGLQKFADYLESCEVASRTIAGLQTLSDPEENIRMLQLLPRHVVNRWERVVDEQLHEPASGSHGVYPPLSEFVRFLKKEARVASGPISMRLTDEGSQNSSWKTQPKTKARTFLAAADSTAGGNRSTGLQCKICGAGHAVEHCHKFLQMNVRERHDAVYKNSLCRGCLKPGHVWRTCRSKKQCSKCGRSHPTVLHDDGLMSSGAAKTPTEKKGSTAMKSESTQTNATSLQVGTTTEPGCVHSMVVPVRLHQAGRPEHEVLTYALLDLQSDACFVKESVRQRIHAEGEPSSLQLSTMAGKSIVKTHAVRDLIVQPVEGDEEVALPTSYSRSDIPADRGLIPRKDTVQRWAHLREVGQQLPPYFEEAEIGILIGINCAKAVKPLQIVSGEDQEPWAMKTILGWSVVGMLNDGTASQQLDKTTCHFTFRVSAKEVSPSKLLHLFETDFSDTLEERKLSQEDHKFMSIMKEGVHQRDDLHMELPLPLKNPSFSFPDNKEVALKRLQGLKRRLARDPKFREEYETFMDEMLEKGYAEAIPVDDKPEAGHVWYVPHHGVYHPKKNKIRVVFDCSAEHRGTSLNSQLLQGPDMGNNLVGVLIRFRKEIVGLSCDVEGMFNQVAVSEEDRNLLRFLWWRQGDITADPAEYRMTTHLFGATSSPACAMIALQETANRYEDSSSKKAANFVRRDFYVDDGLTSTTDVDSAVALAKSTIDLCAKGGFNLHKFASNEPEVLKQLPAKTLAKNLQEVEVFSEGPVLEHALGIKWDLSTDTLGFSVDLPDRPLTRRGILSSVSSLYDPLGLVSPYTLQGKKIIKRLCVDGCDWDDPVPDEVVLSWENWKSCLPLLCKVSVPRCYAAGLGQKCVKLYELHHFCDASLDGYGFCSYLRTIVEDGEIASALVMSKAKVTPKRPLTVPRLELTAAAAAVKGSRFLRAELDLPDVREVFWTDSKVVLGYIYNESKRFHIFVSNRVQQIREATLPTQWRHVTSENNPADITSRGASLDELQGNNLWWHGPAFLSEPGNLPGDVGKPEVGEEDPEVKVSRVLNTNVTRMPDQKEYASLPERLKYFSSWFRAKRAVATILRYRRILLQRVRSKNGRNTAPPEESIPPSAHQASIEVNDLHEAEREILKAAQEDCLSKELNMLKSKSKNVSARTERHRRKKSSLFRLDPFIDNNSLLRVGGRIRRADVSFELAHPVILPSRSHVTELVVRHIHNKVEHSGREATLSEIRQRGYWIVKGRAAVSRCILRCVTCIKLRGNPCTQKMSDLPRERVEEVEPFTFTGVDYFGPFYIREKRSEVKRWAVMFTCLSSRSVHLETANSLTADSFLNAYRRFVGRRGPVRRLYCDQGSNFIGGRNLLQAALKETDFKRIKDELLKEDCDCVEFRMNVPHASHMGGAWERQIRTARAVFSSILTRHGHSLDDELLRTVMVETEAIINGQPLSYCSMSDANTVEPITATNTEI